MKALVVRRDPYKILTAFAKAARQVYKVWQESTNNLWIYLNITNTMYKFTKKLNCNGWNFQVCLITPLQYF